MGIGAFIFNASVLISFALMIVSILVAAPVSFHHTHQPVATIRAARNFFNSSAALPPK